MNTKLIAESINMNLYGTIPGNIEEIIEQMAQEKNLGWKTLEKTVAATGISIGLFIAIKKEIKEHRTANTTRTSSEDARADRILRIRNSDGKATSRK